jgi:hypothetical protein
VDFYIEVTDGLQIRYGDGSDSNVGMLDMHGVTGETYNTGPLKLFALGAPGAGEDVELTTGNNFAYTQGTVPPASATHIDQTTGVVTFSSSISSKQTLSITATNSTGGGANLTAVSTCTF